MGLLPKGETVTGQWAGSRAGPRGPAPKMAEAGAERGARGPPCVRAEHGDPSQEDSAQVKKPPVEEPGGQVKVGSRDPWGDGWEGHLPSEVSPGEPMAPVRPRENTGQTQTGDVLQESQPGLPTTAQGPSPPQQSGRHRHGLGTLVPQWSWGRGDVGKRGLWLRTTYEHGPISWDVGGAEGLVVGTRGPSELIHSLSINLKLL